MLLDSGTPRNNNANVSVVINGGGFVLDTGEAFNIEVPFNAVITSVTLLADITGSVIVDIWKDSYANYPPTVGDSITAASKPTISSGIKYKDTTLTGWTTTISSGDILLFNVDSVTAITKLSIILGIVKA